MHFVYTTFFNWVFPQMDVPLHQHRTFWVQAKLICQHLWHMVGYKNSLNNKKVKSIGISTEFEKKVHKCEAYNLLKPLQYFYNTSS